MKVKGKVHWIKHLTLETVSAMKPWEIIWSSTPSKINKEVVILLFWEMKSSLFSIQYFSCLLKKGRKCILLSIMFISDFGDRKQVSIVEDEDMVKQNARKKREKFKRQDTPLHPHSIRWVLDNSADSVLEKLFVFVSWDWLKSCLQTRSRCWSRSTQESLHQCQHRKFSILSTLWWQNHFLWWETQGTVQPVTFYLLHNQLSSALSILNVFLEFFPFPPH